MVWENFISFNFYKNVFGITSPYALLCSPSLNIVHTHIHKYTVLILSGFQLKKYLYWNFHVPRVLLWPLANQRAKGFWGGALRDDTKNGSEGNYQKNGQSTLMVGYSCSWDWKGGVITSLRKHSKKKKNGGGRASGPDKVGPGDWGRYYLMSFTWRYIDQHSKHMVTSLSSESSCGIFLVSFLVAVAEIECLL